jgi:hypothetical protein
MNANNNYPNDTTTDTKQPYESPTAVFATPSSGPGVMAAGNYPKTGSPCGGSDCDPTLSREIPRCP